MRAQDTNTHLSRLLIEIESSERHQNVHKRHGHIFIPVV